MKPGMSSDRAAQELDQALERMVDDGLRAVVQPPPVDLRGRVLEAIARDPRMTGAAAAARPGTPAGHWSSAALLKPATALAGSLVVLLGVYLTWHQSDRRLDVAGRHLSARVERSSGSVGDPAAVSGAVVPSPASLNQARPGQPLAGTHAETRDSRSARSRTKPRFALVEWPSVAEDVPREEPFVPGAPAGELGDSLGPLPAPPLIAIAPITQAPIVPAPLVSETAQPVTDFPSDSQPPAEPPGDAGQRRGDRR